VFGLGLALVTKTAHMNCVLEQATVQRRKLQWCEVFNDDVAKVSSLNPIPFIKRSCLPTSCCTQRC
ncbi:hypothetical protein, partial [Methylobacterium soli]|uniref:hypothetical protein n=1 Tax=Methylobacterium soli TaxID=553447 RepID=UPI001EE2B835